MNTKTLRILLGTAGKVPYEETAPADILETFNNAVLGQLLTKNNAFELQPGFIKSWRWNFNEKTYELTLRDDIVFHNGRKATAKDLEFALLRGFFTKYRSFYKMFLGNIDGIEKTKKYRQFRSGIVPGVKIIGPYSVRLKLKNPNPTFLYNVIFAYFSLVAKEALQNDLVNWKDVPIGAGPYKVIEQELAKGKFVLEKVGNQYPKAPLKIEVYTNPTPMEYDIVAYADPPSLQNGYKPYYPKYSDGVWTVFFVNLHPLGKSPVFRKALQFGIDRKTLLKGIDVFYPSYEMLPSHFWGRANTPDIYNLKKAKELFSSLPRELTDKVWHVPVFGGKAFSSARATVLKRLQSQLAQIGLKVEFYPSQEKFISRKTALSSPIEISGRVADYIEPVTMFASFRKGSPFEYTRTNPPDQKFEKLYDLANKAQTPEERLKTVRELSYYFDEAVIAVPMAEMKQKYYINPKTIKDMGEQVEPLSLFLERIVKM